MGSIPNVFVCLAQCWVDLDPIVFFWFSAKGLFLVQFWGRERRGHLTLPGLRSDAINFHLNISLWALSWLHLQAASTSVLAFSFAISMCGGVSNKAKIFPTEMRQSSRLLGRFSLTCRTTRCLVPLCLPHTYHRSYRWDICNAVNPSSA